MSATKPKIEEVLARPIGQLEVKIRTVITANIVTFDPTRGVATVQPAPRRRNEAGELVPLAPVVDAPVVFPAGGGWSFSWPLAPADPVLLLVHDRNLDGFRLTGQAYDPLSVRLHDVTDAIVLPGAIPAPNPVTGLSATDLTITGPGGIAMQISPAGVVSLGGVALTGSPVALADALHAYLVAMMTAAQVAGTANVGAVAGEVEADAALVYLAANPFAAFAAARTLAQ